MRKLLLALPVLCIVLFTGKTLAQESVGIGTTSPNPNSILDIDPNSPLGVLLPRLNPDDTLTLTSNPANKGMIFYDTIATAFRYFDGTYWVLVGSGGGAGTDGKSILNGPANPTGPDGNNGDFWINTSTYEIFGPKTTGVWGPGTPLIGADGNTVLNGTVDPTPADGNDGDFYINTNTDSIFGPKTGGLWGTGTSLVGPAGTDGNTILNGTVDPTPGDGNDGDFYINTVSDSIFGPKTAGVWPAGEPLLRPGGANDTIPANVFSARVDGLAATPDANRLLSSSYNWINSITRTGTGQYQIDFLPGFFTQTPSVTTFMDGADRLRMVSSSSNSVTVEFFNSGGPVHPSSFDIIVQRQGADYQNTLTAPPNIVSYLQSNGTNLYADTADLVIGSNVNNPNASLSLDATDKGLQLNRVDTATIRGSLGAGDEGLIIYDPTLDQLFVWKGSNFEAAGSGAGANDTIPANVFSARIDAAGNIISESYPFIQSVGNSVTGWYEITYIPGFFTEEPSVFVTSTTASIVSMIDKGFTDQNQVRVYTRGNTTGVPQNDEFYIVVQRQGADYQNTLTAPPNVVGYLQTNGNDFYQSC
jgi:hypothetical protein